MKKSPPFPRKVKIGYQDVSIKIERCNLSDNQGIYKSRSALIFIDGNDTRQEVACTLLHEILHAVWRNQGLTQKDLEEPIVNALTNGLMQVIKDNPKTIDWIRYAANYKKSS